MKKNNYNHHSGFTIIEVSLVLAIAGLIMVMVFIALPALQRQSRDAERKEDSLVFLEALKKYQQNNRGALPKGTANISRDDWANNTNPDNDWVIFYNQYLGDSFKSPSGEKYTLYVDVCTLGIGGSLCSYYNYEHDFIIFTGATCNGNQAAQSSNPRNVAIVVPLEGSDPYCASI